MVGGQQRRADRRFAARLELFVRGVEEEILEGFGVNALRLVAGERRLGEIGRDEQAVDRLHENGVGIDAFGAPDLPVLAPDFQEGEGEVGFADVARLLAVRVRPDLFGLLGVRARQGEASVGIFGSGQAAAEGGARGGTAPAADLLGRAEEDERLAAIGERAALAVRGEIVVRGLDAGVERLAVLVARRVRRRIALGPEEINESGGVGVSLDGLPLLLFFFGHQVLNWTVTPIRILRAELCGGGGGERQSDDSGAEGDCFHGRTSLGFGLQ